MKKVSFYTLGCKLNQAETASLANEFNKKGYFIVSFGEPCDICVINTCTVTAKTDFHCRQVIRKAIKIYQKAKIAVVGCYAQMSNDLIKDFPEINLVLGSDKKFEIFKYLDDGQTVNAKGRNTKYISMNPGTVEEHTRAFLKIQDGCNNFCSYCIVPYARGRSRSDTVENIFKNVHQLVEKGYKEIVLTGAHIGSYGYDLNPHRTLMDLLKKLDIIPELKRIRLSSLEPLELEKELIEFASSSDKICPHFHIPLQSGDDFILKRMKRNYKVDKYVKIIDKLMINIPHAGLGTDIIVGFPGENAQRFNNTYQLIQELPFTYLHVFTFSPRRGTEAIQFSDNIDPKEKKERSIKLIALGKKKKYAFYKRFIGQNLKILFEKNTKNTSMYGFSENYIRVKTRKQASYFNKITSVKICGINGSFAIGEIIN